MIYEHFEIVDWPAMRLGSLFWRNWSEYLVEDGRISSDQRWQWSGGAKSSETTQLQGVCTDGWPSSRRGWSTCSYSPEVSKLCFLGERNAVRRSVRGLPVKYWIANLLLLMNRGKKHDKFLLSQSLCNNSWDCFQSKYAEWSPQTTLRSLTLVLSNNCHECTAQMP